MEETGQNVGQESRYASRMPNRKYGYFRDDQIVFLVKHPNTLSPEQLKTFHDGVAEAVRDLQARHIEKPLEVIPFPELTGEEKEEVSELVTDGFLTSAEAEKISSAFSMIRCDLNSEQDDPTPLLTLVKQLPAKLASGRLQELSNEGITLEGTSLNWLTSIASQSGGTGGPGGRPFPYFGNRKTAPYCFDIKKQLEEANGGTIYGDGSGVDVVILDTAPCAQDLVAAYKEWSDHPLISTLLGPEGKLHLYPATYEELLRMSCTSLNDHDYKMTDHGLFIAGIIHSIVPKAEIHLVEVLNQYGVGDFTSFVQGFQKVYTEKIYQRDRKLVFNCSWMLEFPREDLHCRHKDQIGDPDAEFERKVLEFSKTDQSLLLELEYFLNRFYGLGRQVVAAAGNDGRKEYTQRVEARYPAALKRVTGVGALPKSLEKGGNGKYLPSVFSNLADTPEKKGIATFGGEEGEGKGILGLYIGEFPGCCRNETKWAWWSGTSFATPILAGAVASVLSRVNNNISRTQKAIEKLYGTGAKIILDGQADRQQDALPVTQS